MKENLRFLGLDVHAETIAVALRSRMGRYEALEPFLTAQIRYAG